MKRLALRLAASAALLTSVAACGISPEDRLDRAQAAFAENRLNEARLDLGTLSREMPGNAQVLELYARTQLRLGDGEGAAATLEKLARLEPLPADFANLQAEAQLLRGRFSEALSFLGEPTDAEGARIAALALIAQGEAEQASATFSTGLEMPGPAARLKADFALYLLKAGRFDEAREMADRALEEEPDALDPLLAAGRVAHREGRAGDALEIYEKANRLHPESRMALFGRIGVLGDMGRLSEAEPLIAEAAKRLPGDAQVTYLQARLAAEKPDWGRVRELLQPLEASEDLQLQLLYSRSLVELGLHEQAYARLNSLRGDLQGNPAFLRLLARTQMGMGDAAGAFMTLRPLASDPSATPADIALLSRAAKQSGNPGAMREVFRDAPAPERVARLLAEGDAALRKKDWGAAIAAYEKIRTWTGDTNAMVLNNLAYAKGQAGQTAQALEIARLALRLAPDHPSVMDTAGWLMVQVAEHKQEGIALLRRAAAKAPGNATISGHLKQAERG